MLPASLLFVLSHSSYPCVEIVREATRLVSPSDADGAAQECENLMQKNTTDCKSRVEWLIMQGNTEMQACRTLYDERDSPGITTGCFVCGVNVVLPPSSPPSPPSLPSPPFAPLSSSCLAHYKCMKMGLVEGSCCPASDGNNLDCCNFSSISASPSSPSPLPPPSPPPSSPLTEPSIWNPLSVILLIVSCVLCVMWIFSCFLNFRTIPVEDKQVENEILSS